MVERLKDILTKIKENKKIILGLTILFALILLYIPLFKWFLPQYIVLRETANELKEEIAHIQQAYVNPRELEQTLRVKNNDLEEQLRPFQWQVLHGEPLLILADQTQVGDKDFKINSLYQGEADQLHSFWRVPFIIETSGREKAVHSYLSYLDQQSKAMMPSRISITYHDVPALIRGESVSGSRGSKDNLSLELELYALGIEQTATEVANLIPEQGRDDIFTPRVKLPVSDTDSETGREGDEEGSQLPAPRYSFPTKNEVKP